MAVASTDLVTGLQNVRVIALGKYHVITEARYQVLGSSQESQGKATKYHPQIL